MKADTPIWMFLLPSAVMGVGNAGMWGPLATTATRWLPPRQAGAGAGIYNTTRMMGSVIGSAAMAAFMQGRLEANVPGASQHAGDLSGGLPAFVLDGFSKAMGQAVLLPAVTMLLGVVSVFFVQRHGAAASAGAWQASRTREQQAAATPPLPEHAGS
jgi:MFS family permease